jgi:membrane fusion protein (multidrug efflux system)
MMKSRSLLIVLVVAAAAAVYFWGIAPRRSEDRALAARAAGTDRTAVNTIVAAPGAATREVILPGTLQAFADTGIYARTSGYLASWKVDLGDQVKEGQVLATIDSPEVNQELSQARANLEQASANLELARVSADRWKTLGAQDAVAAQDVDTKQAEFTARKADAAAAAANVQRLEQLRGFETIVAPFAGVVTARNVNIGNLISPGAAPELFHLSQNQTLRAYVSVPQTYVADVAVGLPVEVLVAEFPARAFAGKIVRFAGALDAASRTLQTEVQIPNADGKLYPGMYCQLRLRLTTATPAILIPSTDVIIRAAGNLVAIVTAQNTLHFQPVKLGRDFGTRIEILDGLAAGTTVVDNPNDALSEGAEVDPRPAPAKPN